MSLVGEVGLDISGGEWVHWGAEAEAVASFSCVLPVRTDVETLWARIRDVRWVAGLFPYVDVEAFHDDGPERWRYRRHLRIPTLAAMTWEEEATVAAHGTLAFRAVSGDLETFDGQWEASTDGAHARLSLTIEYIIPAGLGPAVPPAVAYAVMNEVFTSICRRVKEAVEEGHA